VKRRRTREDDLDGGWVSPMWHDRFVARVSIPPGNPIAWRTQLWVQVQSRGTLFESFGNKDGVDSRIRPKAPPSSYGNSPIFK